MLLVRLDTDHPWTPVVGLHCCGCRRYRCRCQNICVRTSLWM